ncbi:MAG TPA: SWIM zinc finger family protein [Acidimicrobiales bacterium]|nr:SWIM zinc finger family protein [Acidimicrobiales bacterium]
MSPPRRPGWYGSPRRRRAISPARAAGRRPFGASWWGAAWVSALEGRARLDPNRLPRGRTYARSGAVGPLSLAPGLVAAEVQGSRERPYEVRVRVRTFTEGEWRTVLDALAAEIGHAAALLEGELPPAVGEDVRSVGLDLLPGPGELQPRCSCPDWADPCKHAAAVCYLVADALDEDAFGVFLLRGLAREELLRALRARRGPARAPQRAPERAPSADGASVVARAAWSRPPQPLPELPPLPPRPGRPMLLVAEPPDGAAIDGAGLRELAADAARRALALARGVGSDELGSTLEEDLARRAVASLEDHARLGVLAPAALARRAGVRPDELVRWALAYRDGGREGLAALREAWDPDPRLVEAGRVLLGPGARRYRNRLTLGARQLRLGRDGRWYPFRKAGGRFEPDGLPYPPERVGELGALDEAVEGGSSA